MFVCSKYEQTVDLDDNAWWQNYLLLQTLARKKTITTLNSQNEVKLKFSRLKRLVITYHCLFFCFFTKKQQRITLIIFVHLPREICPDHLTGDPSYNIAQHEMSSLHCIQSIGVLFWVPWDKYAVLPGDRLRKLRDYEHPRKNLRISLVFAVHSWED